MQELTTQLQGDFVLHKRPAKFNTKITLQFLTGEGLLTQGLQYCRVRSSLPPKSQI